MTGTWRHEWAEAVRSAADLSMTARMVGQVLALDFANADTGQCNPGRARLAAHLGVSEATIKRALAELVAGKWLASTTGTARNRTASFTFLSPGKVVKFAPPTTANAGQKRPATASERGSNLHRTRVKSAPPYNRDEPRKEPKGARETRRERPCPHLHLFVARGSDEAREFNRWAADDGLPMLDALPALHVPDGYDLIARRPPTDNDSTEAAMLRRLWAWAEAENDHLEHEGRASA